MKKLVIMFVVFAVGSVYAADGAGLWKAKMCGACHGAGKKAPAPADSKKTKDEVAAFLKAPSPESKMKAVTAEEAVALADYWMTQK